jgi:outer membrane protein assembly factor BamB
MASAAALAFCLAVTGPATAQSAQSLTDRAPHSVIGIRFRFIADGPVRGGFGLAVGRLLFGTEEGSIYSLDASNGRLLWRKRVESPVLSTPAVDGKTAFFTSWDNALHAIDAASGHERWRLDLGRTLGASDYWEYYVSSPVLAAGHVYVGSGSGRLFSIDPNSGKIVWSTDLGARVRTTPLVAADRVIVGTMSGHVIAVDRHTGKRLWSFATQGAAQPFSLKQNDTRSVVTAPILAGGIVIAGGRDGNVYGINLRTGAERWRETHDGGSWILGFASDPSIFYSGSGSAFIVQAANPSTGKEVWRTPTGNAMFGGVAKAGDVLVSNGSSGNLFAFDTRSGAQLWRIRLPDMSLSSPLVADGVVYTGSDDGSVYALETSTAAAPKLERYVYSFTNEPAASAFWFPPEALAGIRGGFLTSGYQKLGSAELAQALSAPVTERGRKIVVLADTRLPEGIDPAKLRGFVADGGILVTIGPDPLNYSFDAQGAPDAVDSAKEQATFGIDSPNKERDSGYNLSDFAPPAAPLGLTGTLVTSRAISPGAGVIPLAFDRSRMVTAWIKKFGNGGMLINLPVPRYRTPDLSTYVNAIDLAATRSAAGLM